MRLKEDKSSWKSTGIIKRDNRHDHSDSFSKTKSKKKDTKRWCRGKVGVEHELLRTFQYMYWRNGPKRMNYVKCNCVNCGKEFFSKSHDSKITLKVEIDRSNHGTYYTINCNQSQIS